MTTKLGGTFTFPGAQLTVNRMGYGAMQLAGPHVFGPLAVLSPSVWWARGGMLPYVRRTRPEPRPRIWLDIGLAEGPNMIKKCDELHRLLERRGWRDGIDVQYLRMPDGRHNEDAWAQRVDPFLRFLFPAK